MKLNFFFIFIIKNNNKNMSEDLIEKLVNCMREFQKKNNIKKQCLTNTQYLFDTIDKNFDKKNINAKALPVFVVIPRNKKLEIMVHMVLLCKVPCKNNIKFIIDPSYEIFCLKNKSYHYNFKDISKFLKACSDDFNKKLIKQFMIFINYANNINKGKWIIVDKKFYNKQADYIERKF